MKINKNSSLVDSCLILQKFAEEVFMNSPLKYSFIASSQAVHRSIKAQKFNDLFKSNYWQQLMSIMEEIIAVVDSDYDLKKKRKFLNSDKVLWLQSVSADKFKTIKNSYHDIKNFVP